jgi:hypothetical protein
MRYGTIFPLIVTFFSTTDLPDLERRLGRIHAGTAQLMPFLDMLDAMENIWVCLHY